MDKIFLADVKILNNRLNQSFSYMIDSISYKKIKYGDLVLVEFNNNLSVAMVLDKKELESMPTFKVKQIIKILKGNRINKRQEDKIKYLEKKLFLSKEEITHLVLSKSEIFNTNLRVKLISQENIKYKFMLYFKNKDIISYSSINKKDRKELLEYFNLGNIDIVLDEYIKKYTLYFSKNNKQGYLKEDFKIKYELSEYKLKKMLDSGDVIKKETLNPGDKEIVNLNKKEITLSKEQSKAYEDILKFNNKKPTLLHGVTGSGKTSIFIKLISKAIKEEKQVLILVPEITLTYQMVKEITKYFGNICGVFNNSLTPKQKKEFITNVRTCNYKVIISTRSGIFLDVPKLGQVIVDEEHDSSYKQNFLPFYHIDDLMDYFINNNIDVLLSSATPRLITYAKAKKGNYNLVHLGARYNNYSFPDVILKPYDPQDLINDKFISDIKRVLDKKENTLILFNIKGYSNSIECFDCGKVEVCPNCHVPLKYYKKDKTAGCNYCEYTIKNYKSCSGCNSTKLALIGLGIEKIEEEINKYFPGSILRIDSKIAKTKDKLNLIIEEFNNSHSKILIGTQIISKGLNFNNLNQVIVLNIDNMLFFSDFNSHEKAYQLLEQVSGRSARGKEHGEVIVYTNHKEDNIYKALEKHDYEMFYKEEMYNRKLQKSVPYFYVCQIEFRSKDVMKYEKEILKLIDKLKAHNLLVSKITQPYLEKIGEASRVKVFVKYKQEKIKEILEESLKNITIPKEVLLIDLSVDSYGV